MFKAFSEDTGITGQFVATAVDGGCLMADVRRTAYGEVTSAAADWEKAA